MAKFKTRGGKPTVLTEGLSIDGPLLKAPGGGAQGARSGKSNRSQDLKQRGAPKSKKLTDTQIKEIAEDHGLDASYHENGGVTVIEKEVSRGGNITERKKHFKPNTTLGSMRDWLGY